MEVLFAFAMIAVYSTAAYVAGRIFTPQMGWVYGRRFGPQSEGKLLLHLWLAVMPVGLGLAYWLINHLMGGVPSAHEWGAVLLLTAFAPLPVMMAVSKNVNEYILEGYTQWQKAAVSRSTA